MKRVTSPNGMALAKDHTTTTTIPRKGAEMVQHVEVDTIILSWNRVPETIDAINSALAQKDVLQAIHVVDQGTDPATLEELRAHIAKFPNVHLKTLDSNIGVPAGRNMAASMGTAPIIVALDNDAVFSDEYTLRQVVSRMASDKALGAIGFRILNYYTGEDDRTSWGYSERDWPRRAQEFPTANYVGAGHALRREAFEAARKYEERLFFAWEELELGLKLLNLGYKIRYVGSISVRHKIAPEARVNWDTGRYYYTVRNRIYLYLKSGSYTERVFQHAGGFFVRALPKGLWRECLRGIFDAVKMYTTMPRDKASRDLSRLKPDVLAYLDVINHRASYTFWDRVRNAWRQGRAH